MSHSSIRNTDNSNSNNNNVSSTSWSNLSTHYGMPSSTTMSSSAGHPSFSSTAAASGLEHPRNSNLEVHLNQLQEDQQHKRLTNNQQTKLLQKNLDSLRDLVQEIQADDWRFAANNNNQNEYDEAMVNYFTRMDAWGSKS